MIIKAFLLMLMADSIILLCAQKLYAVILISVIMGIVLHLLWIKKSESPNFSFYDYFFVLFYIFILIVFPSLYSTFIKSVSVAIPWLMIFPLALYLREVGKGKTEEGKGEVKLIASRPVAAVLLLFFIVQVIITFFLLLDLGKSTLGPPVWIAPQRI